jgi:hypothetical protein
MESLSRCQGGGSGVQGSGSRVSELWKTRDSGPRTRDFCAKFTDAALLSAGVTHDSHGLNFSYTAAV